MKTYQINAEEKALLDAAKMVCRRWGYHEGSFIAHANHQTEADDALITMLQQGSKVVGGKFLRDT